MTEWEKKARALLERWRASYPIPGQLLNSTDIFLAEPVPDVPEDVARIKRERDALLDMTRKDAATFRDMERAMTVLGRDTVAQAARIAAESTERLIAACGKEEP